VGEGGRSRWSGANPAAAAAKTFTPAVKQGARHVNREVAPAMQDPGTVVIDVRLGRAVRRPRGHPLAQNAGHLEKSSTSRCGLWSP
jgi:hypothetical protein